MRTVPLGISATPFPTIRNKSNLTTAPPFKKLAFPSSADDGPTSPSSCLCISPQSVPRTSQAVELLPTVCPEIVVREARLEDCWEVAETHCSSFFPDYSFPLDFVLRVDRLMAMVSGFSIPIDCRRTCFVAVYAGFCGVEDFRVGDIEGKSSLKEGYVAGILTVDTAADFLPRRGPLGQRRTGIAYISNVAVRERARRRGIAKRLVKAAEAQARSWGCHAMALHCDVKNYAATCLYRGHGFKSIKVPERANWPEPKTTADIQFNFMMKLLSTPAST